MNEEDIKILEDKLRLNATTKFDWFGEKEFQALENLIKAYKELKKFVYSNSCVIENKKGQLVGVLITPENFIPKSKIKENIEEAEKILKIPMGRGSAKLLGRTIETIKLITKIEAYKELLE